MKTAVGIYFKQLCIEEGVSAYAMRMEARRMMIAFTIGLYKYKAHSCPRKKSSSPTWLKGGEACNVSCVGVKNRMSHQS